MENVGKLSIPVPWILWGTVFRAYLAVFQNPPVIPSEVLEDYGVNEKNIRGRFNVVCCGEVFFP